MQVFSPGLLSPFITIRLSTNNVQGTFCPFPMARLASNVQGQQHGEWKEILSPVDLILALIDDLDPVHYPGPI